jgi:hypothetical protein
VIYVYLSVGALFGAVVVLLGFILIMNARHEQLLMAMSIKAFEKEQAWAVERQQLLDRIQSPSFAEYKHQEVKVIKAKNEKEPEKLEVL